MSLKILALLQKTPGFTPDLLTDQIYDAMKEVPEVTKTEVKLVWTPAWTIEKMSRYARIALGIR